MNSAACLDHGRKASGDGYVKGLRSAGFRDSTLHRQVFFQTYGYLPTVVMHSCDNPRCINPAHLVGGTQSDNQTDMKNKGRGTKVQLRKRKLTMAQASEIKTRYPLESARKLAKEYGVVPCAIYNLLKGATYVGA